MRAPGHSVTLTSEQIEALHEKLREFRHNVNNHLALVSAATELLRHKPEMAGRLADSLEDPPQKISREIKRFSDELERILQMEP